MLNPLFNKRLNEAALKAAEKVSEIIRQSPFSQCVIGIEDTTLEPVVGFGKVIVATDFFDESFANVPTGQRFWLNRNLSTSNYSSIIRDLLRNVRIMPSRVISNGKQIDIDAYYKELYSRVGHSKANQMIEELQLAHSIVVQ